MTRMALLAATVGDPVVSVIGYGVGAAGPFSGSGYTYNDATVFIQTDEVWQNRINAIGEGTEGDPKIIGVAAGVHPAGNVLGCSPKNYQYFIGQTDGVPTTQFPNGTPISIVDGAGDGLNYGTQTTFLAASGAVGVNTTGVVVENLEIRNFSGQYQGTICGGSSAYGGQALSYGPVARSWLWYNCFFHHMMVAVKPGSGTASARARLAHCVFEDIGYAAWETSHTEYLTIENCRVERVNPNDLYEPSGTYPLRVWAAGTKIASGNGYTSSPNIVVRYNTMRYIHGAGIWFDGNGYTPAPGHKADIYGNLCEHNTQAGIFWELQGEPASQPAGVNIHDNKVRAFGNDTLLGWPSRCSIYVSDANGNATYPIKVYNNVLESDWPLPATKVGGMVQLGVGASNRSWVDYVEITDNTFTNTNTTETGNHVYVWDGSTFDPPITQRNITIDRNDYTAEASATQKLPFRWQNDLSTFAQWQSYGHDLNGTYTEV